MAPHSSTLAWKISWTEEPGRLQSMGSLRACAIVRQFEHSLALPFFGIGMKTDFFSSMATAEFSKFVGILSASLS